MVNLKKKLRKHPNSLVLRAQMYGVSEEFLLKLYAQQNGQCSICGASITFEQRKNNTAQVDHCHKTNKVRGLLCGLCNRGLGFFKDSVVSLKKAVKYLKS